MRTNRATSRRQLLAVAAACAALAACGGKPIIRDSARTVPRPRLVSANIGRKSADSAALQPTVDGMVRLGYDLIGVLDSPNANLIVSPASVAYAFGMVRAGARGETGAQIDRVLHFPTPGGPHEALNAISQQAVALDPTRKPPVVAIANGLFSQVGLEIRPEFLRTIAAYYGAGVLEVDFSTAAALDEINGWVADNTAGRIKKVFDQLDPNTRLVLTNAVYLKAGWLRPFEKGITQDGDFTTAQGTKVAAKLMRQPSATFGHAVTDRWQAVELPYAGGELAMRILIPAGRTRPLDLLQPATLQAIHAELEPGPVDFTMPRFDFATSLDRMKDQLVRLGLTVPFGDGADFSGITARGLFISQVVHKANISVDEYGTEAAAVTGIAMDESAAQPAGTVIRADRPFAFTIVHKPTGTPLFAGQVTDPAKST